MYIHVGRAGIEVIVKEKIREKTRRGLVKNQNSSDCLAWQHYGEDSRYSESGGMQYGIYCSVKGFYVSPFSSALG